MGEKKTVLNLGIVYMKRKQKNDQLKKFKAIICFLFFERIENVKYEIELHMKFVSFSIVFT